MIPNCTLAMSEHGFETNVTRKVCMHKAVNLSDLHTQTWAFKFC